MNFLQIFSKKTPLAPSALETFSFGEPIPMGDRPDILGYLHSEVMFSKWYQPPLSLHGLAKALHAAPHHATAIYAKVNMIMSTAKLHSDLLDEITLKSFIFDYLVFGNAYLELVKSRTGKPLKLFAPKAKYVRRGVDEGKFYLINELLANGEHEFAQGSIYHWIEPDINQEIYGLPQYLAALQSVWLNESATLFRRKYYVNGAHAGFIFYMTDTVQNQNDIKNLKAQLRQSRGVGNFKNLFVHAPNGKKDGIQIIPLADVSAKDEFLNIKNVSRDDMLAIHRVPPQLIGIIPNNTGGFGDVEKAAQVFFVNEIEPIQKQLMQINRWLGQELITFTDYKLLANLA